MRRQRNDKLNRLQELPEGRVVTSQTLAGKGYSRQLVAKYVQSGWLEKVGHGAYRRPGAPLKWQHVVYSLQAQGLDLHPGGETALALLGRAHQIPVAGRTVIHLYGAARLPPWVAAAAAHAEFRHHAGHLFGGKEVASAQSRGLGFERYTWGPWDWVLRISSMERAWLEVLQGVPGEVPFDVADELATGLQSLRPRAMETWLQRCRSIKVRRLALWMGERHRQPWLSKLDRSRLDLGSGKRSLAPGGRLIKQYGITVPQHLADGV
jgi:hypothetical protein